MADHFVALNRGQNGFSLGDFTVGSSSTASTDLEVRVADGANLTRKDIYKLLEAIKWYFQQRDYTDFPAN